MIMELKGELKWELKGTIHVTCDTILVTRHWSLVTYPF